MERLTGKIIGLLIVFVTLLFALISFKATAIAFLFIAYIIYIYFIFLNQTGKLNPENTEDVNDLELDYIELNLFNSFHIYVRMPGASKLFSSVLKIFRIYSLVLGIYALYNKHYIIGFISVLFLFLIRKIIFKLDPIIELSTLKYKNNLLAAVQIQKINSIVAKYHAEEITTLSSLSIPSSESLTQAVVKLEAEDKDWPAIIANIIAENKISNEDIDSKNIDSVPASALEAILIAEAGDSDAQYKAGSMYLDGKIHSANNPERDYMKAIEWYEKSAAQGNQKAQFQLGWMYFRGKGIEDRVLANAYFRLSFKNGNKNAGDWVEDIDDMLNGELDEAKFLANTWKPGVVLKRIVN